jgi:DNA-binding SARP family transcriptional activator
MVGAVSWCYYLMGRFDDARRIADDAEPSPQAEAMQFATRVELADSQVHYRDRPPNSGMTSDALLARIDLVHGRFMRLLEPSPTPWGAARSSRVAALRAVGRLDEALALCQQTSFTDWTTIRVYVEVLADLGRVEEARAALVGGRELLHDSGSPAFDMYHALLSVMLDLRFERDTAAAAAALERVERTADARLRIRVAEQLDTFWGLIGLLDDKPDRAAEHLRLAVETMVRWDRLFMLPAAAVYLAEAEWRLDNEDAADAAADLALATARRQGCDYLLLRALRWYPAVVSRRLDAEREVDSAWHDLGRALMAADVEALAGLMPHVLVREFGSPAIVVDTRESSPRLSKSVEIAAYLAAHGRRASRAALLDALFDGRADESARAYLRQALSGLRRALPPDAPLVVGPEDVAWEDETLSSDSTLLQAELRRTSYMHGRERLEAQLAALDALESGPYLPGIRSQWVTDRAAELDDMANEIRHDAAKVAYELGDYALADQLLHRLVREDPYREASWRLSMQVAAAMGDGDRVIALFRGCERALSTLRTTPAESTCRLLEALRR